MDSDRLLRRIASEQHGLVSRAQARACGMTKKAIAHRVRRGEIVAVTHEILRFAATPDHEHQRALAAVMNAGLGGCLCLDSAAALWGFPGFRLEPFHVWRIRDRSGRVNVIGVQHKTRRLPGHHLMRLHSIPVTSPSRTLADLAARVPLGRLARLVDHAWSHHLTDYHHLDRMTAELSRRGRAGIPALRQLTQERGPGYLPPESGLERRVMRLLDGAGLTGFDRQVDVGDDGEWIGRVDFRHRPLPLVLEVQSALYHASLTARADDTRRIARLRESGLIVVELWEDDIWQRPDHILDRVRCGLRDARALTHDRAA